MGQYSSEILLTMHSWHLNSHLISFQHASSSIRIKRFILFSRTQFIFRLTFDQVETSIPSLQESAISSGFMAVASRSVDYYQIRTSSLTYVRGGAPYPSGYSLPLLDSASLVALALVHALSVALPRPVSSLLLAFADDASPSVGFSALLFRISDSQNNTTPYRDSMVHNFRGTSQYLPLSVIRNPTGGFRETSSGFTALKELLGLVLLWMALFRREGGLR